MAKYNLEQIAVFLQDALEFMSVIAVMVNCALVGFSGLADRLWPDMTTTERIVFIVILEVCENYVHISTTRKRSLGQGNVFTPVSFCSGGEVGFPACITGHMTRGSRSKGGGLPPGSWADPPQVCLGGGEYDESRGWADPPRYMGYYEIRSTSRRYASYWNVFLFISCKNSKLYLLSTSAEKVHLTFPSQYIVLLR